MVQLWENVDSAAIGMTTAEDLGHGLIKVLHDEHQKTKNSRIFGDWTFAGVGRGRGRVLECISGSFDSSGGRNGFALKWLGGTGSGGCG